MGEWQKVEITQIVEQTNPERSAAMGVGGLGTSVPAQSGLGSGRFAWAWGRPWWWLGAVGGGGLLYM